MSDAAPVISVIVAAYNGADLIGETLAALAAQTYGDFEVVIVDDRSTDTTRDVVRGFDDPRIRLIEAERNGGPVVARNLAFAAARGRYIAGLDQDDLPAPSRFAQQVAFLDANPDVVLVSSAADVLEDGVVGPGRWPRALTPDLIDWLMLIRNPIVWSSVMFRADAARRLDPFERPERRYVEDFDLYHRLRRFGRIAQIDAPLVTYRSHAAGASQRFNTLMLANAELVLGEVHAARYGLHDPEIAVLLVRHVMGRQGVGDGATLRHLFAAIERLRVRFVAGAMLDEDQQAAVRASIAALWWDVARASVRSGALSIPRAIAARPEGAGFEMTRGLDLALSQVIGGVRAAKGRIGARR